MPQFFCTLAQDDFASLQIPDTAPSHALCPLIKILVELRIAPTGPVLTVKAGQDIERIGLLAGRQRGEMIA